MQGYHVSRLAADLHDFLEALDLDVRATSLSSIFHYMLAYATSVWAVRQSWTVQLGTVPQQFMVSSKWLAGCHSCGEFLGRSRDLVLH